MLVGIDFGTSYSFISVMRNLRERIVIDDIIPNKMGIPTKFMHFDGKDRYGEECETYALLHASDLVTDIKTKIRKEGQEACVVTGERGRMLWFYLIIKYQNRFPSRKSGFDCLFLV